MELVRNEMNTLIGMLLIWACVTLFAMPSLAKKRKRCSFQGGTHAGDAHRLSRVGSPHDESTAFFKVKDLGKVVIWQSQDFDNSADPPVTVDWTKASEKFCRKLCQTKKTCQAWEYGWYSIRGIGGYYCVGFSELYYTRKLEDIGGTGSTRFANYAGLCA